MFSTPSLNHLNKNVFENVYEPAEDSFLVLDALEADIVEIKLRAPSLVLEIGSGSGILTAFIGKILGSSSFCICTDINYHAAVATTQTVLHNRVCADVILTDLAAGFLPRIEKQVDLLLFNPPYVITPSEEVGKKDISAAWSGGREGREVIDRFLKSVDQLMSSNSLVYLCVLKENKPDDIANIMNLQGFDSKIILSRRCGAEQLHIMRFSRS